MGSETIRIGIVGGGDIVRQRHMPGLQSLPDVAVTAVCNRRLSSTRAFAKEYNIPKTYDSWEDLLADPHIDVVWIGTWPYLHHPISMAALDLGKHVFCQARMAMDYHQAKQMYEKTVASGKVAMVCPQPATIKVDTMVRELLKGGYVGDVRSVHVRDFHDGFVDPQTPYHWRIDRRLSGYNVLSLGLRVEMVHYWFGWTSSVQAMGRIFTEERRDLASGAMRLVEYPEALFVHSELASGAVVTYELSAAARYAEPASITIYGSEGTLKYELGSDYLLGARAEEEQLQAITIPADELGQWTVEADFITAIREGKPPYPSFEDGMRYMEVTEAVWQSMALGERIELPLD